MKTESPFLVPINIKRNPNYAAAAEICQVLNQNGFEAFFVGGFVRDLVLQRIQDLYEIDIATNALPKDLEKVFPSTQTVGESFLVSLIQNKGFSFEVASFRVEEDYRDARRPTLVRSGSLQEDSCRRDFTVNALYFNPIQECILDFHNGLEDLKNGMLRTVGEAKQRFSEDALRILRLHRFAANLSFKIEAETLSSANLYKKNLTLLSKERIVGEIKKVNAPVFSYFFESIVKNELSRYFPFPQTALLPSNVKPLNCSKEFYFNYPLLSFLLQFATHTKSALDFENELKREWSEWPITKDETKYSHFLSKIIQMSHQNTSPEKFYFFLFQEMRHQNSLLLGDFLQNVNVLVEIIKLNKQHPLCVWLNSFDQKIKHLHLMNQTLYEWTRSFIKVTNESLPSEEVAKLIKLHNLPISYTAVSILWMSCARMLENREIPFSKNLLPKDIEHTSAEFFSFIKTLS